jgi:PEP-CTERM motif
MKSRVMLICCAVAAGMFTSGAALAATIVLTGDFVQVSITDDGTLGQGSGAPGLVHDPSGTGTFDANTDYIRPGSPFEGFGVRATSAAGSTFLSNRNQSFGSPQIPGGPIIDISGGIADNAATWSGTAAGLYSIDHTFWFNDGDERINIITTITALTDLTDVSLSRAVDPDPDVLSGGSFNTNNDRGLGPIPIQDLVTSSGSLTGRTLGLFSTDATPHNTGIDSLCCSDLDPLEYLGGGSRAVVPGFDSTSDDAIGIGFRIGELLEGESRTVNYAYVMGGSRDTVIDPGVPEPTSIALVGIALLAGAGARKKRA